MCTWSSANAARASETVALGLMVLGNRTTTSRTSWPSKGGVAVQGPGTGSVVGTSDAPLVQARVAAGGGSTSRVEMGGCGLIERSERQHERVAVGVGHAGHDVSELLLPAGHHPLDERPAFAGQGEHPLSSVGSELAAIDESGRDQPVAGTAGVGRVDAEPLGDG